MGVTTYAHMQQKRMGAKLELQARSRPDPDNLGAVRIGDDG